MNPKLSAFFTDTRKLHSRAIALLAEVNNETRQNADAKQQTDAAYALREIAKLADDIRKCCEQERRIAERMACMLTIQSDGTTQAIKTEYCTATQQVKTLVSIPKQSTDPEGFATLMRYLNVPEALWNDAVTNAKYPAVQLHWPGLCELLSNHCAEGKPLPKGIDPNKTSADYTLTIRGRRAPDAGEELHDDVEEFDKVEGVPF